jgi:hypothetical protein
VKTNIRNNKKRLTIAITAILLALGISLIAIYYISNGSKSNSQPTPAQIEERPVGDIDYGAPSDDEQNPTLDPQENFNEQDGSIGVSITYADGTPLQIRILIDEVLPNGTCTAVITKDSKTIATQTVDIFATSNSTTCKGFTIDSPVLSEGVYNVEVTVKSDDKTGTASKQVIVK